MLIKQLTDENIDVINQIGDLWVKMLNETMALSGIRIKPDLISFKEWLTNQIINNRNGYACFYAVDENNRVIGFIDGILYYDFTKSIKMGCGNHFYVLPEYRGFLSIKLLRKLINLGKQLGIKEMGLVTWSKTVNQWKRFGFHKERYIMIRNIGEDK